MTKSKGLGLIHICYGAGVKTSRAVGLAIRAVGVGLNVDFVQFMKFSNSGGVAIFEETTNIHYRFPGKHPFVLSGDLDAVHYDHAGNALNNALEAVGGGTDLLICDEMLDTFLFNLLQTEQIIELIEKCNNRIELVMTGRDVPPEIVELADYVTEFVKEKYPYYSGARARKRIE